MYVYVFANADPLWILVSIRFIADRDENVSHLLFVYHFGGVQRTLSNEQIFNFLSKIHISGENDKV